MAPMIQDGAADPAFAAYLRAKAAADKAIRARTALDSTIVRPGLLTDEPGTGLVTIADSTGRGSIPREDVAAVLVAVLDTRAPEVRPSRSFPATPRSRTLLRYGLIAEIDVTQRKLARLPGVSLGE